MRILARPRHHPPGPALATLALGIVLTASPAAAEPPKLERLPIVDRAIELHGGERYRSSATVLEVCSRSGCYAVRSRVDGDLFEHRVRGEVSDGERVVTATNDTVVWLRNGERQDPGPEDAQRMRDWVSARIYFCFLPYRLNDPGVYKQDLGLERWGDRDLHRVKVTFQPGSSTDADDEYTYWLDPETGRVELFAYSYQTNGGGLRFRRAFNHRRVGGILFFDQENLGLEGPDWRVDDIDPALVETMREISTVELRDIRVTPISPD